MKSKTIRVSEEWYNTVKLGVRVFNMSMGDIARTALKYAHNNSSQMSKIKCDYKGEIVFKFKYKSLYGFTNDEIRNHIINRVLQYDLIPIEPEIPQKDRKYKHYVDSVNNKR
jgi:hypothetical protein